MRSPSPRRPLVEQRRHYADLLRYARRCSRRSDEAEDLLQTVLMAATEAGRADLDDPQNRRWLRGALRKRAAFDARSAVRRRAREQDHTPSASDEQGTAAPPQRFLMSLPPGLRTTARLSLSGHTKREIMWLLGLTDAAMRQRVAQLRRRWRALGGEGVEGLPLLSGSVAFGRARSALRPLVRRQAAALGSHDPDGHLFVLGTGRPGPVRPPAPSEVRAAKSPHKTEGGGNP